MERRIDNYGRFYSAFNKLTIHGDRNDVKAQLVLQFTGGRSYSLKDMTRREYVNLCNAVEEMNDTRDELKRRRSIALKLMQKLGVDTTDWTQINDFCCHQRIAGRPFGQLSSDELTALSTRLRAIQRKGWERLQDSRKGKNGTILITLASSGHQS